MSNERDSDLSTFLVVVYYCSLIIFSPVIVFFSAKYTVDILNGGEATVSGNVFSAVCAVIALHLALGIFIFKACSGDQPKDTTKKD